MGFGNAETDGKPQSGPLGFLFTGIKRRKNTLKIFGRDTYAVVFYRNNDPLSIAIILCIRTDLNGLFPINAPRASLALISRLVKTC